MLTTMRKTIILISILALVMVVAAGCEKRGEEITLDQEMATPPPDEMAMPTVPSTVLVSEEIASQWKAVVLELTDLDTSEQTEFTLNIGDTVPLGDSGLTVFVEAFLPDFTMMDDSFSSRSAEPNNPAARVKITDESGTELYYRFLFANQPTIHPFEHDRYGLILKDYIAAE
jgi:hypothetical protein